MFYFNPETVFSLTSLTFNKISLFCVKYNSNLGTELKNSYFGMHLILHMISQTKLLWNSSNLFYVTVIVHTPMFLFPTIASVYIGNFSL